MAFICWEALHVWACPPITSLTNALLAKLRISSQCESVIYYSTYLKPRTTSNLKVCIRLGSDRTSSPKSSIPILDDGFFCTIGLLITTVLCVTSTSTHCEECEYKPRVIYTGKTDRFLFETESNPGFAVGISVQTSLTLPCQNSQSD